MSQAPPWGRTDRRVILALLIAGILVILAIGRDYGRSWDEADTAVYARQTLDAYRGKPLEAGQGLSLYGPFAIVVSELVAREISSWLPGWSMIEARHASYFLSFLAGAICVYVLARGYVGVGAALAGALLFATQPLLLGHAFINPKDMPFLGFFAGAVAVGLVVVRSLPAGPGLGPGAEFLTKWQSLPGRIRRTLLLATGGSSLAFVEILVLRRILLPGILAVVEDAYNGKAVPVVQALFLRVATDRWKTGLDAYLAKAEGSYTTASWVFSIVVVLATVAWATWFFFPTWRKHYARLLGAGAVVGLATAIRVVGPFAAVLVSLLILYRLGRRALLPLAMYWSAMPVAAYLTWPSLWKAPVQSFLEAAETMSGFPWYELVLFGGQQVPVRDLPWSYAFVHFGLQLTLVALFLGVLGGAVFLAKAGSRALRAEAVVLWAWLLVPFVAAIALDSVLYDGARQLLFVLPPLFVMASFAFEKIFDAIRRPVARLVLAAVFVAPGLAAVVALHPYQYLYFNELTGGVAGASGRFELDYWGTSYREIMLAMAEIAPAGATIGVSGPLEAAQPYARADLVLIGNEVEIPNAPDFQVVLNRWGFVSELWPEAPVVYAVERGGALLALVRDLRELDG